MSSHFVAFDAYNDNLVKCRICDATLSLSYRQKHIDEHIRRIVYMQEEISKVVKILLPLVSQQNDGL